MWNTDEKQRLKKIIISKGIKRITDTGFAYVRADEIIFPESLSSIDRFSFHSCFIDKITIKNPALSIGSQAFAHSTLKEIRFPNTLREFLASTGSIVLEQCDYADNFKKGGVETDICPQSQNKKS